MVWKEWIFCLRVNCREYNVKSYDRKFAIVKRRKIAYIESAKKWRRNEVI